jgi:hypothetical protein
MLIYFEDPVTSSHFVFGLFSNATDISDHVVPNNWMINE